MLPALVYGWSGNVDQLVGWFTTVTGTTEGTLLGADNVSLAAMWAKWIGIGAPATALATVTTGAALGLVATVWVRRREIANPDYLEFALLLLLIPLLSPQGWDYVLLLGTPAVVCLLDRWSDVSREWKVAHRGVARADGTDDLRRDGPHALRALHGDVDRQRRGARRGRGVESLAVESVGVAPEKFEVQK